VVLFIIIFSQYLCPVFLFAKDWYVRPSGGTYGTESGVSYDNAWNGLLNVMWGKNGVKPGDSLYVCGIHVHDVKKSSYIATQAKIHIISGKDESRRITLRGDYPGDPGIIWGSYRMSFGEWKNEGSGVWSIELPGNSYADWFFQDIGKPFPESFIALDQVDTLEKLWNHPGGQYSVDYLSGSKIYIHCTDSKKPNGRIYGNRYGYGFVFGDAQYVTFKNLSFLGFGRFIQKNDRLSHVKWDKCHFAYGEHSLLGFWGANFGVEVINCKFSWAENGIYTISGTDDYTSYYRFNNNYFENIGVRKVNRNTDAHSIGIQGGVGGEIKNNIIKNCGTGPLLYSGKNQEVRDTIVSENFVKNLHTLGNATGYGVSTMSFNNSRTKNSNNKFFNNVVMNSPVGYRFQFLELQEVYNNISYNCTIGLESGRNSDGLGANVRLRQNIFLNSGRYHIRWYSGAIRFDIDSNNNLFYPIEGRQFNLRGKDLSWLEWKKSNRKYKNCVFDPDSLTFYPKFKNHSGYFENKNDFVHQLWD
jgi:hypothetical protein